MSKRTIQALFINCILISSIYASNLNAQHIASVRDVDIKIKMENSAIMDVFRDIEARTNFEFSFKREDLDPELRLSGKFSNSSVADVLMEISRQSGLRFKQINNNIHISKQKTSLRKDLDIEVVIDGITITGKVTSDDDQSGLPGVNVMVKGTSTGTVTDVAGSFTIEVPNENSVLVFSSVGYLTEEVAVGNKTVIDLVMTADITALEEIVVIGYGTQEKKDVTGAVESVKAEQIQRIPVAGFNEAMQGQVAGVYITQPTGQPGGTTQVQIRGAGSINAGNAPLYVIDGMIVQNGASSGGQGSVDVFSSLNPNDIESIDILKDASAAAIYGARGANGVIIVTTKSGINGPAKFSFDAYYGVQTPWKKVDMLNATQYQTLMNEARDNSGDGRIPALDGTTLNTNTNWQDEIFVNAPIQNYNLSVQGGSESTKYFLSAGYFDQRGIIKDTGMKRGSVRFNLNSKKGIFRFGNNITLSRSLTDRESIGSPRSILMWAAASAPHLPVYDENSVGGFAGPGAADGEPTLNPVAAQTLVTNDVWRNRIMGNIYGEIEFFEGFTYRLNLGGDIITSDREFYAPDFELGGQQIPGFEDGRELQIQNSSDNSYVIENTLNFDRSFGKHHLGVLVGYTAQEAKTKIHSTRVIGGNLNTVPTISGGEFNAASGHIAEWSMTSLLGRIIYDFDGKYLFTGNIRRDGSSRFGENNKYGVFPSVSAGWRISEEAFLSGNQTISNLKLRASYGVLGNDRIPNYAAQVDLNPNANIIMGRGQTLTGGVTLQREMPNQDLKWEQVAQFDIGVDLGMFDNKFLFIVDYYKKRTTDMLLNASVPTATGFATYRLNAGEVENRGWEFTATYRKSEGEFNFDISANLTTLENEVISLGPAGAIEGRPWSQQGNVTRTLTEVGHPIGSFYGYIMEGIFQTQAEIDNAPDQGFAAIAPGDIRWKDIDGFGEDGELTGEPDGKIDLADRTFIGNPLPKLMYGATFNASYKGFDLFMLFQGVSGNSIFSESKFYLEGFARTNNLGTTALNRWTGSNPSNEYPRAYPDVSTDNNRVSSRWIQDGSYLRLKNMQIGYNLPESALETLKLERARVYIGSQNLLTFTDYEGWEPEVGSHGIDELTYPQARSVMIGLQLGF